MSEETNKDGRSAHSNSIIKNHMIWSMGAGFIPVPIADFFAVSAIQLDMIRQLSKVYEINFKETEGKAIITALTGSGLARLGARAVKFIPGVGTILGGVTLAALSGGSTYALGEVFKKHFETGGTFLDFDPSRLKKYYDEKFEKGKRMAKDIEPEEMKKHAAASQVVKDNVSAKVDSKPADSAPTDSDSAAPKDFVAQLESITKMKESGALTTEEFETLKKKILDAQGA